MGIQIRFKFEGAWGKQAGTLNLKISSSWRMPGVNELGIQMQFEFEGAWGNELGIQIWIEFKSEGDCGKQEDNLNSKSRAPGGN